MFRQGRVSVRVFQQVPRIEEHQVVNYGALRASQAEPTGTDNFVVPYQRIERKNAKPGNVRDVDVLYGAGCPSACRDFSLDSNVEATDVAIPYYRP